MLDLTKFDRDDTCGHCGADYGLHQHLTDLCPRHGSEAPVGRDQQWGTTTYTRADTLRLQNAAPELLELCRQQQAEIERLKYLPNGISEALNSGDGVYRP